MPKTALIAAITLGAVCALPATALAQPRWSTPQPQSYDTLCGEPDNAECYTMPFTGNLASDGGVQFSLHCEHYMAVDGVRGPDGALRYSTVNLAVDGQPLGQFEIGGGLDTDYLTPRAPATLVGALRAGSSLTLVFDGVSTATVSLAGSSAAIAALDSLCNDGATDTAAAAPAETRQRQYFDDYMATCQSDGSCDATTFSDTPTSDGNSFSSTLVFNRLGYPGTAWIVSFAGAFEGPVAGTPIQVRIGQQVWTLAAGDGYGEIFGHNFFTWPANEQIFAAMRTGSTMEVTQTIETGASQTVVYSLRGLNAALAWIDGLQARSGEPAMIGVPFSMEEIVPGYEPPAF